MPNEENLQASTDEENKEMPSEIPATSGSESPAVAGEIELAPLDENIDLNKVFPDENTDLNELFPDLEMKSLLKKVQKNKKDLNTMRDRISDGI